MQIYRFGFEVTHFSQIAIKLKNIKFQFYKEMTDGVPQEYRYKVVYSMVHFAKLWMSFVTERCERGRGKLTIL